MSCATVFKQCSRRFWLSSYTARDSRAVASMKQRLSTRRSKESEGEALARSLSPSASVDPPISAEARDNGRAFPRTAATRLGRRLHPRWSETAHVFHVHPIDWLWNRSDFVRPFLGRNLTQRQAAFTCPGADRMQRAKPTASIMRATHRLAVDGDRRAYLFIFAHRARHPRLKTSLKRFGFERGKNATNTIPRWNAVGQRRQLSQPIFLHSSNVQLADGPEQPTRTPHTAMVATSTSKWRQLRS